MFSDKVLIIYGPTATGKTDLGIKIAKKYNGELISADSRQIYKKLDIGTGKVSFDSKIEKHDKYWIVDGVKINGFDIKSPGDDFSTGDYIDFANKTLTRITREKKLPIIVGGSGFYVTSLINPPKTLNIPANKKLREELEKLSTDQLFKRLSEINKKRALSMNDSDKQNPRRLIRAIETSEGETSKEEVQGLNSKDLLILGLTGSNEDLYKKVDDWLEKRLEKGLEKEVSELLKNGLSPKWLDNLGLEYRWLTRSISNEIQRDSAIESLKGDIHSFVRRQKTWFNKFSKMNLFDISDKNWQDELDNRLKLWYTLN